MSTEPERTHRAPQSDCAGADPVPTAPALPRQSEGSDSQGNPPDTAPARSSSSASPAPEVNLTVAFAPSEAFTDFTRQGAAPAESLGLPPDEFAQLKDAGDRLLPWLRESEENAALFMLDPIQALEQKGRADPHALKKMTRQARRRALPDDPVAQINVLKLTTTEEVTSHG